MRDQQGHINQNELDKVQDTKSASRFSLYELKAMSKQGDIGGFWRIIFPVQKFRRGGRSPFNKAWNTVSKVLFQKPSPFSNVAMKGIYLLW